MSIIISNSVCWSRFKKAGIGRYSIAALSWMFRNSKIPWDLLLQISVAVILGDVTISLTKCWVCQQLRKRPPMIRQVCCHSRGSVSEDPILTAAKRFVGTDQIIAGHADGKLGLQPAHRTGDGWRLTCKVGIPQPPVKVGSLYISSVNRLTGRF